MRFLACAFFTYKNTVDYVVVVCGAIREISSRRAEKIASQGPKVKLLRFSALIYLLKKLDWRGPKTGFPLLVTSRKGGKAKNRFWALEGLIS